VERRVRAKPEVRREQILDQAMRLIGERGYYGFGIKELAQRCGLGNAGLLHHFGSKERLLISLLEDRDRKDLAAATSFLGWSRSTAGAPISLPQFRAVLRDTVQRNTRNPELIRLYAVLQAEALNHEHPAHDYFLKREVALLDAFISALSAHVAEPRSVARQLHAQWQGLEQQWLRADQGFDIVGEWERAVAKLLPPDADAPLRLANAPTA
jgi:AcrR family transcriptional regulator